MTTRNPQGAGSLRERSPGVWESRVPGGIDPRTGKARQVSRTFHGNARDAQAYHARLLVELADSGGVSVGGTVGYLLDAWIANRRATWAPKHLERVEGIVANRLRPALGSVALTKLGPARLDKMYQAWLADGLGPSTVRKYHNVVHASLRQGVRWGWLLANPADRATPPSPSPSEITVPSDAQVDRIIAAVADQGDREFLVFLALAAATGARRGELCGLRLNDLNRSGTLNTVAISRAVTAVRATGTVVKEPKTRSSRRIVHVDDATAVALQDHLGVLAERAAAAHVRLDANPWLFSWDAACAAPPPPDPFTQAFTRARERAGVTGVRLHDLRHRHATILMRLGIDVVNVAARLGHARSSTTLNIYGHAVEASDIHAAEVWGARSARSATCGSAPPAAGPTPGPPVLE